MESESPESGLEELMRLSQQFTKQGQEHTTRELNVSMAMEQLKLVATPDIIEEVNSLNRKQGTEDLRKLISNITDDLENHIGIISASNPDMAPLERSMKTLNILIELFFSLQ